MQPKKALHKATQALYGLQRFQECCDVLKVLCIVCEGEDKNFEAVSELLGHVKCRLNEQKRGRTKYNFEAMYKDAESVPPIIDYATYKGPIEVQKSSIAGRGLFTTKAVKAGELLLCEKAFQFVYTKSDGTKPGGSMNGQVLNIEDDGFMTVMDPELLTKTVQKLSRNPSLIDGFVDLYHGNYESVAPVQVDGKVVIDT